MFSSLTSLKIKPSHAQTNTEKCLLKKQKQKQKNNNNIRNIEGSLQVLPTMTYAEEFYSSNIVNCVFNAFLSYAAIALNSVTIYAMTKTSSLPKNLKVLLLSLAVSDLGVGLIVQPLFIAKLVTELEPNVEKNLIHKITCAFPFMVDLLCYASFFGVIAVGVDRFLAIHLHLRYQELVTHKRVVAAVILLWVLSVFRCLARLLDPEMKVLSVICATLMSVCLITSAILYYNIYSVARNHTDQIQALQVQQQAQNVETVNGARLRKSAIGTLYVYLTFLVCYLPYLCTVFASLISGLSSTLKVLLDYASTLVCLNSSLYPLLYCWKMRHIRHAIRDTLRKIFPSHK